MRTFQKAIEAAHAQCEKACDAAIADVRTRLVIPYCDRHGCRFIAGMGGWNFVWPDGRRATHEEWSDVRLPKRMCDALCTDYPLSRSNDCGSMMADYTPKAKS